MTNQRGWIRARVGTWIRRIIEEIKRSFTETHTPHQIAASFAIGVFITMLPTLGTGLLVFFVLIYFFEWINRVALFASVIVLNPVVKWGVYAASISLGFLLLGPVDGPVITDISLDAGWDVLVRLWVGNLILALVATAIAYVAVYRFSVRYQDQARVVVESVIDDVEEDFLEA